MKLPARIRVPIYELKRRAKSLARERQVPLHAALDVVAGEFGFPAWSLLAARAADDRDDLLSRLSPGDLLLIGARPGQGKTRLALQLLLDASDQGRRAVFFTFEYTLRQAEERMSRLRSARPAEARQGCRALPDHAVEIDVSDDICANYVMRHLAEAPQGTVAVIDYLQILDQRRTKPPVSVQIEELRRFARQRGIVLAFISQIDRAWDPVVQPLPELGDVRLPNDLDMALFSKACFLHEGRARFHSLV